MKMKSALSAFVTGTLLMLAGASGAAAAVPELSFSITPAGPGGTATATVALTDVSDVESFSLLLDLGSGTVLQLPATGWFTRGSLIPASPFGGSQPVELNNVFESTARKRIFLYSFKPTGLNGAVATVNIQVDPNSLAGANQPIGLAGEYFSKSTQKVGTFSPVTRTFTVTNVPSYLLSVSLAGTGGGAVNSNPNGIACTGGTCQATFAQNTLVNLIALPDSNSNFTGWSACSGTEDCGVTMTADKTITASFAGSPSIRLLGTNSTFYSRLQDALNVAGANSTIQGRVVTLIEQVIFNRPSMSVRLNGGYDSNFANTTGKTTVKGKLVIRNGALRVDRVAVQ